MINDKVSLNAWEIAWASLTASMRARNMLCMGHLKGISEREAYERHYTGAIGEIAFCKIVGAYPDFSGFTDSKDTVVQGFGSVDVKYNKAGGKNAPLLINEYKIKQSHPDFYALIVGPNPENLRLAGFMPSEFVFQVADIIEMPQGRRFIIKQSQLSLDLQFLKDARFARV